MQQARPSPAGRERPRQDLEISEDEGVHQRSWSFQRAGWTALALIAAAGLLGIIGPGPLSKATAGEKEGPLSVGYERFAHAQTATQMHLRLGAGAARGNEARVAINSDYLHHMRVEDVEPRPESATATEGAVVYTFRVDDPSRPTEAVFHLEPEEAGRV